MARPRPSVAPVMSTVVLESWGCGDMIFSPSGTESIAKSRRLSAPARRAGAATATKGGGYADSNDSRLVRTHRNGMRAARSFGHAASGRADGDFFGRRARAQDR